MRKTELIDYIGKRIGRLEVICCAGRDKNGHILVKCKCDCGNECVKALSDIKNNHTKSCGCLRRENSSKIYKNRAAKSRPQIGDSYGNLTVIGYDLSSKHRAKIVCKCKCGNIKSIGSQHWGEQISCGCAINPMPDVAFMNNPIHIRRKIYVMKHGEVDENNYIISLDGDITNLNEDNLIAVNRNIYNRLSHNKLLGLGELTKTAALAFQLSAEIYKKQKEREIET